MKKFRLIALMAILFCTVQQSTAQNYTKMIGIRGGLGSGITFRNYMGTDKALEIIGTRWRSGFNATVLLEFYDELGNDGLRWFYGFGGHIGFFDGARSHWIDKEGNYTTIGVDGIIGLDYTFPFNLNLSLDYKPAFNLIGHSGFWGDGGALSIRYAF